MAATELKLPSTKIGEFGASAAEWLHKAEHLAAAAMPATPAKSADAAAGGKPKGPATLLTQLGQQAVRETAERLTRPGRTRS
jgi:carbonic anhydrase